jgi:hypothetical protein
MKCRNALITYCFVVLTFAVVLFAAPVSVQSQNAPGSVQSPSMTPQDMTRQDQGDDVTRQQLASFDNFLDSHPEIAQELRRDPSLVDKQEYVQNHPALQQYLADHPEIREEYKQHPDAFMRHEEQFDRREDRDRDHDVTRGELAAMDRFMDSHPEIAQQLRKDPALVDDRQFIQNHPALQQFLADHPGVREEYKQHPDAFMHDEERFDRRQDQDRNGVTRGELANMDRFMDSHPEIAEQLRKDPALVDNQKFVQNHPALQQFLADHPGVREEYKQHPYAFMRDEERFDQREDSGMRRDHNMASGELASFNGFLESHSNIASELSKNPSLANNEEYLENHPELRDYLKANPQVHQELSQNPETFIKSAQQFDTRGTPKVGTDAKPKQ